MYLSKMHPLIWIYKRSVFPKWFWQKFCQKKDGQVDHSYLDYALEYHRQEEFIMNFYNKVRIKFVMSLKMMNVPVTSAAQRNGIYNRIFVESFWKIVPW